MTADVVLSAQRGAVRGITINRPGRRNSLNREVVDGIAAGIDAAHADPGCRAIVVTGAGDAAFCAGADLKTDAGGAFEVDYAHPQHDVVARERLDERIDATLAHIVANSPTALRLGRQALRAMQGMTLPDALEFAQVMVPVMASTEDAREGMRAFREKGKPTWTGR